MLPYYERSSFYCFDEAFCLVFDFGFDFFVDSTFPSAAFALPMTTG